MGLIYRTLKAFPLSLCASFEADWPWVQTAGEHLRVSRAGKESRYEVEVS